MTQRAPETLATKAGEDLSFEFRGYHYATVRYAIGKIEREAMLKVLGELEIGFANNPKHHEAVIARVREAIEKAQPLPTEAFAAAVKGKR